MAAPIPNGYAPRKRTSPVHRLVRLSAFVVFVGLLGLAVAVRPTGERRIEPPF